MGAGRTADLVAGVEGRSLVLNATFEPLGVVSARRALVLVLGDKADALAEGEARVRSEKLDLALPSVVRLRRFVKVPHRAAAPLSRHTVLARDRGRCQYCGDRADGVDHVVPRSRGGADSWDNVVAACRPCNARKGDRLPEECGLRPRRAPRVPPALSAAGLALMVVPELWRPWLPEVEGIG